MNVNCDTEYEFPSDELVLHAEEFGGHVVNIEVVDQPPRFHVAATWIPRIGDALELPGAKRARVNEVYHKLMRINGHLTLVATVRAALESPA
jgi:hypothetical protein